MAEINSTNSVDSFAEYDSKEEYRLPGTIIFTLLTMYAISSSVGLVGNIMLITQNRVKKKLKPVHYYLTALASSGILLLFSCVPFTVMTDLFNYTRIFGRSICSMLGYTQTASVIQFSWFLIAASVERYLAICRPLRPKQSPRMARGIVGGIWCVSLALPVPVACFSTVESNNATTLCVEIWPTNTYRQIYIGTLMILTYVLPLLVLTVTYGLCTNVLSRKIPGEECERMVARRFSARNKNIKEYLFICISYCICWLPIHVLTIIGEVDPSHHDDKSVHVLWDFAHWMAVSISAVPPMFAVSCNSKFSLCLSKLLGGRIERESSSSAAFTPQRRRIQEFSMSPAALFHPG